MIRTLRPFARLPSGFGAGPSRPLALARGFQTGYQSPSSGPVDLAFDVIEPKHPSSLHGDQCLVICHGLFGSKQNWRSLSKRFAQELGMPVYCLDLRNHGASPHVEPHTSEAMAEDIAMFLQKQGIKSGVNLMGHSMGGKSVMTFALNPELNAPLRSMISVDMAPYKGKLSKEFTQYADSMLEIEHAGVSSRAEADKILQKVEPDLGTRQFLLTNTKMEDGKIAFRIPLNLLKKYLDAIGDFPYTPGQPDSPHWDGPALFLQGTKARYINERNIPVAKEFFPNMQLVPMDTGHWVHAEKPNETVKLVETFIKTGKATL